MPDLLLTAAEIESITGLKQHAAQAKWLRRAGLTVLPSADGRPVVSRMAWERLMGGLPTAAQAADHPEPDPREFQVKGLRAGNVVVMRRN